MAVSFASNRSFTPAAASADTSWNSQGFLNMYLPTQSGSRRKLGYIGLQVKKVHEAPLIEWLNADHSRAGIILKKLILEYVPADAGAADGYALSMPNVHVLPGASKPANGEKPKGYLNMYLPSKDGTRSKLGAIALRDTTANDKAFLAWLNADQANVDEVLSQMTIDYQPAGGSADKAFDLS